MSYKTPEGRVRVWTSLPEEVGRRLQAVAARHRRRLPEEVALAVEQYVEREERERGRPPCRMAYHSSDCTCAGAGGGR